MATNPNLLIVPLAENGNKNTLPENQGSSGQMSQSTGFPPETSLPLGAGGVAPSREDFNGAFNLLGGVAFYAQKGWQFQFDAGQEYFAGCIVRDTTDGKLYECLNDVAAGGSVPSADAVNWKEFGVDTSTLADTDLSNLTATGEDHFLEQDFTIIYPNGGTEAIPANIVNNSRYVESNPFAGYYVDATAELLVDSKWTEIATWVYDSSTNLSQGITVQTIDDNIIIRTGLRSLFWVPTTDGNPLATALPSETTSAPCRLKIWKIGKVANS